jgi:signal peptidase II
MTKHLAMRELESGQHLSYISDLIRLQYEENPGGMLSIGSELPEEVRFWVFTVSISCLLTALFLFVLFTRSVGIGDIGAASLVIGGGLGNLLDRILYDGMVIDFLNVGVGGIRTAVFNVADIAILTGVGLFVILHFRHGVSTVPPNNVD